MQQQIITIYNLKNDVSGAASGFVAIGELNRFESAILRRNYCGYGSFEIWAPITEENRLYFNPTTDQSLNFVYFGKNVAGIVENVQGEIDAQNHLRYHISGRTCEALLCRRAFGLGRKVGNTSNYMIANTTTFSGLTAYSVIYNMLKDCFLNSAGGYTNRKMPFFTVPTDSGNLPTRTFNFQRSGGNLYDAVVDFLTQEYLSLGFCVQFDPVQKLLIPHVYAGVNRSASQSVQNTVIFSDQLDDILQSSYIWDDTNYRNVAYIAGEGEGSDRSMVQAVRNTNTYNTSWYNGTVNFPGFALRELFVDARDITRKSADTITANSGGNATTLTDAQYFQALAKRGTQRLGESNILNTFNATIRTHGNRMYTFGADYNLGDVVTVEDTRLGFSVDTRITSTEETFGSDYSLVLTFGEAQKTLGQKLAQIQDNMTN